MSEGGPQSQLGQEDVNQKKLIPAPHADRETGRAPVDEQISRSRSAHGTWQLLFLKNAPFALRQPFHAQGTIVADRSAVQTNDRGSDQRQSRCMIAGAMHDDRLGSDEKFNPRIERDQSTSRIC